jgi:hypothetical protein
MKKIILSILALTSIVLSVNGQSLRIIYQGSVVVNDSFITANGSATSSDIGQNLWVLNNTTDTLNVKVTKYELNVTAGTLNATCWDVCPPADTAGQFPVLTSPTLLMDPGTTDYSFAAHVYPRGISGCSHFKYVFEAVGTSYRDSVEIYFNHGQVCSTPAAINNVSEISFDVYPNPVADKINLKLDDNINEGEIVISNILGVTVARYNVNEFRGNNQISVSNFENGLYFLSVVSENRTLSTKSIQILK